jgi:hypothetical protein
VRRQYGTAEPVIETPKNDKRFKDPAWEENTLFDFIKQSYSGGTSGWPNSAAEPCRRASPATAS